MLRICELVGNDVVVSTVLRARKKNDRFCF
jgi:hypothetical protein